MGLFVKKKASFTCKYLWTQVARYLFGLLPTVNEGVLLQITFINERLIALWAVVLDALVNLLVA